MGHGKEPPDDKEVQPDASLSLFVAEFKTILGNRCESELTDEAQQKPHLLIIGTGGYVDVVEFHPTMRGVPIPEPAEGVKLPSLLVTGPGVAAFQRLTALLLATQGIGDYLSQEFLEDKVLQELQYLALDPPGDDSAWADRVKQFIKSLRGLESAWRVFLPVVNLRVFKDLAVGKVRFRPQGFELNEIVTPLDTIFESKTNPPEEKEQIALAASPLIQAYKHSPCGVEVPLTSHESKAPELAHDVAREAINLFRCYLPVLFGDGAEYRNWALR